MVAWFFVLIAEWWSSLEKSDLVKGKKTIKKGLCDCLWNWFIAPATAQNADSVWITDFFHCWINSSCTFECLLCVYWGIDVGQP